MKKSDNLLRKNFLWNNIGTTINAFNSLIFMIIAMRINNIEEAGIFTFAYAISALFNIIGNYYGRIYQITDKSKYDDSDFFWSKASTCLIMLIISIIYIVFNGYNPMKFSLLVVLIIYRTLEAFSEVYYAYFQKNGNLYKVGISLTIKNVLEIISFAIVDYLTKNIILSSLTITLIYFLIMVIYDRQSVFESNILIVKPNYTKIIKLLIATFSTFALAFLIQILINIPRFIIDEFLNNELNAIWGIIIMPSSVMVLIGQFCLHPFIIELNNSFLQNKTVEFKKLIKKISFGILYLGFFIIILFSLVGIPIFNFVYNLDLSQYKFDIILILIGATFYGIQNILYNILVSLRIIKEQIIIYLIEIIVSVILFAFLICKFEILGASISYLISMSILLLIYIIYFHKIVKRREQNA